MFEIGDEIGEIEIMGSGVGVRERARLERQFGQGRWRKLKGTALVRLQNGRVARVELHWYEARGIGRRKMKIKRYLNG